MKEKEKLIEKIINWKIVLLLFVLVLAGLAYFKEYLKYSPFDREYMLEAVSFVTKGVTGRTYIIDSGRKKLLVLDAQGRLVRDIEGGDYEKDFYYAFDVCDDRDGNIYIHDVIYGAEGSLLMEERVIRLRMDGSRTVLYSVKGEDMPERTMAYGNIMELTNSYGKVYFLSKINGEVSRYIAESDTVKLMESIAAPIDIADITYDAYNERYALSTRQGNIYRYLPEDNEWQVFARSANQQLPWFISARNGVVYMSDVIQHQILTCDLAHEGNYLRTKILYDDDTVYNEISTCDISNEIFLTDNGGYQILDPVTLHKQDIVSVENSMYGKAVIAWILVVIGGMCILFFIAFAVKKWFVYFTNAEDKASILRVIMVVFAALFIGSVISYTSIQELSKEMENAVVDNMLFTASVLQKNIDVKKLLEVGKSLQNYDNEEFCAVREPLDRIIDASYDQELYLYYVVYGLDDYGINIILDYERSYACGQPIYEYGDNINTEVMNTKTQQTVDDISSYGALIYTEIPLFDEQGNVVAELEVGTMADRFHSKRNAIIKDNLFTVLSSSAVVTMLIMELLFAINFYDKKKRLNPDTIDSTQTIPIRLMVFLIYMSDCMQDAFIALLCERLYEEGAVGLLSFLPSGIAIAFPLSMQLLFGAVASFAGGSLANRTGTKKLMTSGLLIQMCGFIICAVFGDAYTAILIGKILIGTGEGITYVAANTLAALTVDAENSSRAFSDISAGLLSGVSIGAGFGATLLSIGSYHMVYAVAACTMFGAFLISLTAKDFMGKTKKDKEETDELPVWEDVVFSKRMTIIEFLKDRRSITFLMFVILPFMISLSFRDYFFPLFAGTEGMSEVRIGQFYLLCGLLTLYIGPVLSNALLKKTGPKNSVIFASVSMVIVILAYVIYPGLYTVLAAVIMFSVVTSFAYTCQYSYFESIPSVVMYGEGASLGVYSMFDSFGQTLGPIFFGVVLAFGNRNGLLMAAICLLAVTVLFILTNIENKNKNKKE